MSIYGLIILSALVLGFLLDALVVFLNIRALGVRPSEKVAAVTDLPTWEKTMAHARAKAILDIVASGSKVVALLIWWFAGGFPWLDRIVASWALGPLGGAVVYVVLLLLLFKLFSQPFKLYHTFVLETRFGFNRTSVTTFLEDRAKGFLLALVVGGPFLVVVLFFFHFKGEWVWLYFWGTAAAFVVLVQYLAPVVLMPLFNRFTPMPDGSTRQAIQGYLDRIGLPFSGIFTMDGSRRSTRTNAFLTGLGRGRRIVLFDTLLARHGDAEVVAVLAHEVGHLVLGHLRRVTVVAVLHLGLMSVLLAMAMHQPALHHDFFMERVTLHGGFVFFVLLAVPLDLLTGPVLKWISRRHEYAADRFAVSTLGDCAPLVTALKRLARENLTGLTPHPWHVILHHSHPPVLDRIAAIEAAASTPGPDDRNR
ncbi:MAG: M48 family metallopeptidase [Magnetococcales bacterium]|nr:M48 family metallopeptidase [Magnetococcales bacterium]